MLDLEPNTPQNDIKTMIWIRTYLINTIMKEARTSLLRLPSMIDFSKGYKRKSDTVLEARSPVLSSLFHSSKLCKDVSVNFWRP